MPLLGQRYKKSHRVHQRSLLSALALGSIKRVDDEVEGDRYRFESCTCFCESVQQDLVAEIDRYGNDYSLVICKNCGLMRANPRWTKKSYDDFYADEYRILYGDIGLDFDRLYRGRIQKDTEVYDFIIRHARLPSRALVVDIGCGMGTILIPFHHHGHDVMGVDYGKEFIRYGREKFGLNLQEGGTDQLKKNDRRADCVILHHVFEHMIDLRSELENIRQMTTDDAYIYIAVPGTFWWFEHVGHGNILAALQNAHVWQFSLETLRYVMETNGWKMITGTEEIVAIFQKNPSVRRDLRDVPRGEYVKTIDYLKRLECSYLPRYYLVRVLEKLGVKSVIKRFLRR